MLTKVLTPSFFHCSAPYCSAHQTKRWSTALCWPLGGSCAGHAQGWGTQGQPLSKASDSFLLPRGLPSCNSVFEGRQPSYTPGSYFGLSCKDCDGNWQNTAPSVHMMEGQDVTDTHLSAGCVHMCGCECVHDGGVAISRDQMSFAFCP